MPPYRLDWTGPAKTRFGEVWQLAIAAKRSEQFRQTHRETMFDLSMQPERMGSYCYSTKAQPSGEVRYLLRDFLEITFVFWPTEHRVVILLYTSVPASWPECDPE
jgi:hypothetical protein